MKLIASVLSAVLLLFSAVAVALAGKPHDIEDFIRKPKFKDIKISPTGEYYAATVHSERKTALAILRRADNKLMASMTISSR